MMIIESIGNKEILSLHKTAFLCSRKCPASVVLKSYDWAKEMRNQGQCVISGNHSKIEMDVLHYLLKGTQPIILVLARGLKKRLEPDFTLAAERQRLFIAAPFRSDVTRITQETANRRNEVIIQLASEIVVAYAQPGGNLERLVHKLVR